MATKSSALIVEAVVRDGKVTIVDAFYRTRAERAAKKWGDGTALKIRIEPEDDAIRHGQRKHLHGHLIVPVSEKTGYTVRELKDEFNARFLPEDWMTSSEDMNHEQYAEYIRAVEEVIQLEYPVGCWEACMNAMALHERQSA